MSLTNYELWTFQDAIDQVLDINVGRDASPQNLRMAKRAVIEAYRDLPEKHSWRYFGRTLKLTTSPAQTEGTLAYDHTGGTHERLVTLTGGAVPDDAVFYELIVAGVRYEIEDRKSSTTFTLSERSNPGQDIAPGTGYTLVRDSYPLPDDFGKLGRLTDVQAPGARLWEVSLDEATVQNRFVRTINQPYSYAIFQSPKYPGGLAIKLAPSPTDQRTYDAVYYARPRPLKVENECEGSVSVSSGGTSVTGSETRFSQNHVGAIIRFGTADSLPTGIFGSVGVSNQSNPYQFQSVIKSVASATSLELATPAPQSFSDVKYTISDRLDLEAGSMLTYFMRLCEEKYAFLTRNEKYAAYRTEALRALEDAKAADYRDMNPTPGGSGFYPTRLSDIGVVKYD